MAENIELVDLDPNLPDDYEGEEEEDEQQQEETNVDTEDTDWRDESVIIIDTSNPDAMRNNLDAMRDADRELGKRVGVMRRGYTEDKKSLLREIGVNINKGDGPSAKTIFEKLKVTVNRKGKINGAEFDGVRIIVQKGKTLKYTEDEKKVV